MLNIGYFEQGFVIGVVMLILRVLPAVAALLVFQLSMVIHGASMDDGYAALLVIIALLAFIVFPLGDSNEFYVAGFYWITAVATILSWLAMALILLVLFYVSDSAESYSRPVLLTWLLLTPIVIFCGRIILSTVVSYLMNSSKSERRSVVAGVNPMAMSLAKKIEGMQELGLKVDGFFEDRSRQRLGIGGDVSILGGLMDLPDYVRKNKTSVIFIAVPIKNVQRVTDLLNELHDTTASIYFVPDVFVFDLIQCRTVNIQGIPAVALCETPFYGFRGVAKRLSDIVIASLAVILLSPVMLLAAVAIKLTSSGNVIFRQRRYGLDGHEMVVYKFRSMTVSEDSDDIRQVSRDDQRLTPIGLFLRRFSIDELPQLINVLQGRMSIVGPRPHAVAHNETYRRVIKGYMIRHKVAPGMTGLAQISGFRGETESIETMQKRIELDLEYLRDWSFALDMRIIFKTIMTLFSDDAAY